MVRQERLRNNIFQLLIGLFLISCSSEKVWNEVDINDERLEKKQGVYYFSGEPFYGKIIEYFQNGDTAVTAEYDEGKKNGVTQKFWRNGQLKFEGHYKNGVYHGVVSEWYEDGAPFSKFNYKEGKESGRQQAWKPDGTFKANYDVIGDRKYGLTGIKNCSNVWEE